MAMPEAAPLFVLGLGPGSPDLLAPQARVALHEARCIAGYGLYLDLIQPELKKDKRLIASGMRHERQRCQLAIESALGGETTAMVCSGDPGVYAMASLVLELLEKQHLSHLPLEIIPGVPAFCAAAAALGAPVGHDFACVSLSDLLTPLDVIFGRLEAALAADFVVILYNPRSRGRANYLDEAMKVARKYRRDDCPVGVARNVSRPGEQVLIASVRDFDPSLVDMLSIVIVGNSQSRSWGKYMVTPRGYPLR